MPSPGTPPPIESNKFMPFDWGRGGGESASTVLVHPAFFFAVHLARVVDLHRGVSVISSWKAVG